MGRWEPGAPERLQLAAVTLFLERGYDDVTVAEIADAASLTKRTFFNHFCDKREVLFADARGFQAAIVTHLAKASADLTPLEATLAALTHGGQQLEPWRGVGAIRRDLIRSSVELQERNLQKLSALTDALTATLRDRGVPPRKATLTAQAAVAAFTTAYDDSLNDLTTAFPTLLRQALRDLRQALTD